MITIGKRNVTKSTKNWSGESSFNTELTGSKLRGGLGSGQRAGTAKIHPDV